MKNDGFGLITGASRGLGTAFARALAQRHYNLVLVARSAQPLHALGNELRRAQPVSVVAIQVDRWSGPNPGGTTFERRYPDRAAR